MVVEIILQLCINRILPLPLFHLVFDYKVRFGRNLAFLGLFFVHGYNFVCVRLVLWWSWCHLVVLVCEKNIRCCQSGLVLGRVD